MWRRRALWIGLLGALLEGNPPVKGRWGQKVGPKTS